MAADEIGIQEKCMLWQGREKGEWGGLARMGSEMNQLCTILICGKPISFAVEVGRCGRDKQDSIKLKGTSFAEN